MTGGSRWAIARVVVAGHHLHELHLHLHELRHLLVQLYLRLLAWRDHRHGRRIHHLGRNAIDRIEATWPHARHTLLEVHLGDLWTSSPHSS
jgi:hypothetical protein